MANAAEPLIKPDTELETGSDLGFADLGVAPDLIALLEAQDIVSPFRIQQLAIPDAMSGVDVLGKAKTGSGKTLAFGLPMIERLVSAKPKQPLGLVLVPTRELCLQVTNTLRPLLESREYGIVAVYGGAPMREQIDALRRGVEVVVATPGRLIDLLERKALRLDAVDALVLDEADEMADRGFLPQVQMILRQIQGEHQTMLFSATLDHRVEVLVRNYMVDPVFHEVESDTVTVETSQHRFLEVHRRDKPRVVARLAATASRTLVFVRTKQACDHLAHDLREIGVKARPIHGDLHQSKREQTLAAFASDKISVLVATNVAARGLHIDGVDVVIHYDPPEDSKTYLHRSGRTARAGEDGLVVTLVEWDQVTAVNVIKKEAGLHQPIVKMFSNDDRLQDLASWSPPLEESPEPARPTRRRSQRSRRRSRLL